MTGTNLSLDEGLDPFPPQRLRDLLHRKALATERHRGAVAQRLGLSATEVTALAYLAQHGRMKPGELGERLYLTSGGTTALLHRLERAGHIRREPHPLDKRSTFLTATPEIIEAASELFKPVVARIDDTSAQLSADDRLAVGRYLERIVVISEEEADATRQQAESQGREQLPGVPAPGLWS
jgi:DNA-binding MarR family transcriptional regulator